jgi:hypothetical protein
MLRTARASQIAVAGDEVVHAHVSIERLEPIMAGGFVVTKFGTWFGSEVNQHIFRTH